MKISHFFEKNIYILRIIGGLKYFCSLLYRINYIFIDIKIILTCIMHTNNIIFYRNSSNLSWVFVAQSSNKFSEFFQHIIIKCNDK